MTKYEYTKIKGLRIQQLIDGIPPFVDIEKNDSYDEIFNKELKQKKLPFIITRPIGYKEYIDVKVSDMDVSKYLDG